MPSLVTLLEALVLKKRRRLITELGGPLILPGWFMWLRLLLLALDLGCTVISLPMDVRPDSELALQLPLDELLGSSL